MAKAQAEPAPKKAGRGRPTKFDRKMLEQARKLALLGLTDVELADVFLVTDRTIASWKKTNPEFLQAITRGRVIADADVAASLYHRALGYSHAETVINSYQGAIIKTRVVRHYPPDTQAASIWLRNRHPSRWRSQPEPMDGTDEPLPVKVVVEVRSARKRPDDADPE